MQNLGLALAAFLISVIVADLVLPLFRPITKTTLTFDPLLGLRGRSGVKTIWTREVDPPGRPVLVQLNSSGFHDREYSMQKSANTFRIVALGDSYVEAYQVAMEENFSKLLEQKFNQRLSAERKGTSSPAHIEVLNQGIHATV